MNKLYFAYGSNIHLEQMAFRCPAAQPLMPVVLSGYELTFRGSGVATVIPKIDAVVPGLLWSITPECEKSLDRYEGYPHLYHKADVAVTDPETGKIYYPMLYEMDGRFQEPELPSPMYFVGIMEGYAQNNMDARPLIAALKKTAREAEALQDQYIWRDFMQTRNVSAKEKKPGRGKER